MGIETLILVAAVVGTLANVARLALTLLAPDPTLDLDSPSTEEESDLLPYRWIMGRVRVRGLPVWSRDVDPPGSDGSRVRDLHQVIVLAEGQLDAIERVWVDSEEVEFTRSGTHLTGTGKWDNRFDLDEHFTADGTGRIPTIDLSDKDNREATGGAVVPIQWTSEHQLRGVSYVYLRARSRVGSRRRGAEETAKKEWKRFPRNITFLVRGNKIITPFNTDPSIAEWTNNPAAWLWWFYRNVLEMEVDDINLAAARAAFTRNAETVTYDASQLPDEYVDAGYSRATQRYACNGVYRETDDNQETEAEIIRAMAGHVTDYNGQTYMYAGARRTPVATLTAPTDLVDRLGTFSPGVALQARGNTFTMQLRQSAQHSYTAQPVKDFVDTQARDRDGRQYTIDLGVARFVNDKIQAARIMAIIAKETARATAAFGYRVKPGPNFERLAWKGGDHLLLTDPGLGFTDKEVVIQKISLDKNLSVVLELSEFDANTYDDTLVLPNLQARDLTFGDHTIPPVPTNIIADVLARRQKDGTASLFMQFSWDERHPTRVESTNVRIREVGSPSITLDYDQKGLLFLAGGYALSTGPANTDNVDSWQDAANIQRVIAIFLDTSAVDQGAVLATIEPGSTLTLSFGGGTVIFEVASVTTSPPNSLMGIFTFNGTVASVTPGPDPFPTGTNVPIVIAVALPSDQGDWFVLSTLDNGPFLIPLANTTLIQGDSAQYQLQHVSPSGEPSDWTTVVEITLDGDLDPPPNPTGEETTPLNGGYAVKWTRPVDAQGNPLGDYAYTLIEQRPYVNNAGVGNFEPVAEDNTTLFNRIGLTAQTLELRLSHFDRSGNQSGYTTATVEVLAPITVGNDGVSYRELTIFRVVDAGDPAPTRPTTGSVVFSTGVFTPPTDWIIGWPAHTTSQSVYASVATADNRIADTWTPLPISWTPPVVVLEQGDINAIYRRFATAPTTAPPPSPGVPTGYSNSPSITGTDPIYISIGVRAPGSANFVWPVPTRLEGKDGLPGIRGLTSYTHRVALLNYRSTLALVTADGRWVLDGGGGSAWPASPTLTARVASTTRRNALARIPAEGLVTIYKDAQNWADYEVNAVPTVSGTTVTFGSLTLVDSVGSPSFATDDTANLHFTPVQEGGTDGVSYRELHAFRVVDITDPAPTRPTTGSFVFTTRAYTPPTDWVANWPAHTPTQKVYIIAATADNRAGNTWTPLSDSWSNPVTIAQEGDFDLIYRRFDTAPTAAPAASAGVPTAWSNSPNITGTDPIYVSLGIRTAGSTQYVWQLPVRLEGKDGLPGIRGLASYSHNLPLATFRTISGLVVSSGHWSMGSGGGNAWPLVSDLTLYVTSQTTKDLLRRIQPNGLVTIFKDATNWGDYEADTTPTVNGNIVTFGSLTRVDTAGSPAFGSGDSAALHYSPAAAGGQAGARGNRGAGIWVYQEDGLENLLNLSAAESLAQLWNNNNSKATLAVPNNIPVEDDVVTLLGTGSTWVGTRRYNGTTWVQPAKYIPGDLIVKGNTISLWDIIAGADVRSINFRTGIDGWRIAQDGSAEFDAAIIRGILSAAHIDSDVVNWRLFWQRRGGQELRSGTSVTFNSQEHRLDSTIGGVVVFYETGNHQSLVQITWPNVPTADTDYASDGTSGKIRPGYAVLGDGRGDTSLLRVWQGMNEGQLVLRHNRRTIWPSAIWLISYPTGAVTTPALRASLAPLNVQIGQTLSATAHGGTGSYTYQWQSRDGGTGNFANIAGATGQTYIVPAGTPGGTQIQCVVTDSDGTAATTFAAASVVSTLPPLVAVVTPAQPRAGQTLECTASGGDGSYTYQWEVLDGGNWRNTFLAGNDTATLPLPTTLVVGTQFRCTVTDGRATSVQSQTVTVLATGLQATLSTTTPIVGDYLQCAVAGGRQPYTYHWQWRPQTSSVWRDLEAALNGDPVFSRNPISSISIGIFIRCQVTDADNITDTATTTAAVVASAEPLRLEVNDAFRAPQVGSVLAVGVFGGSTNPQFQWQRRFGTSGSWTDINDNDTVYVVQPADAGYQIRVRATVPGETVYATTDTVIPGAPIVDPQPPPDPDALVAILSPIHPIQGQLVTCQVQGGTSPYTYQWQRNGVVIGGVIGATYTPTALDVGTLLSCRVQDSSTPQLTYTATAASSTTATAQGLTAALSHPSPIVGDHLRCTPSGGTSPYTYFWQWRPQTSSVWQDLEAALNGDPVFSRNPISSISIGIFIRCIVTDSALGTTTVATSTAVMASTEPLRLEASEAFRAPQIHSVLGVTAFGGHTNPRFQWQRRLGTSGAWININDNDTVYVVQPADSGYQISVLATTPGPNGEEVRVSTTGVVASTAVSPVTPLSAILNPVNPTQGQSVRCEVTGLLETGGTVFYQWRRISGSTTTNIPGANSQTYTPQSIDVGSRLSCQVTQGERTATATSTSAVAAPTTPALNASLSDTTPRVGQQLRCVYSGGSGTVTFQWYLDGAVIAAATSSTYTPEVSDVGGRLSCTVRRGTASATATATGDVQASLGAGILWSVIGFGTRFVAINRTAPDNSSLEDQQSQGIGADMTWDGSDLIMATGGSQLAVVDPLNVSFDDYRRIEVPDGGMDHLGGITGVAWDGSVLWATDGVTLVSINRLTGEQTLAGTFTYDDLEGEARYLMWTGSALYTTGQQYDEEHGLTYATLVRVNRTSPHASTVLGGFHGFVDNPLRGLDYDGSTAWAIAGLRTTDAVYLFQVNLSSPDGGMFINPSFPNDIYPDIHTLAWTGRYPAAALAAVLVPTAPQTDSSIVCNMRGGTGAVTYQWQRNGANIADETFDSYIPRITDLGALISCVVTRGSASVTATSAPVTLRQLSASLTPRAPVVGQQVVCRVSGQSGPTTYQWLRGADFITGANLSTYTPIATDIGETLACRVTRGGVTRTATATTSTVALEGVLSSNSPRKGQLIKCRPLLNNVELTRDVEFQWVRGGTDLGGATSQYHVVTDSDIGDQRLGCRITYRGAEFTAIAFHDTVDDASTFPYFVLHRADDDEPWDLVGYSADLQTNAVHGTFDARYTHLSALEYDGTNAWATDALLNKLLKFDLAAPGTVEEIDLPTQLADPGALAWDGTRLWCVNNTNKELWRIDTATSPVTFTLIGLLTFVPTAETVTDMLWSTPYLWATAIDPNSSGYDPNGTKFYRIDPTDLTTAVRIAEVGNDTDVTVYGLTRFGATPLGIGLRRTTDEAWNFSISGADPPVIGYTRNDVIDLTTVRIFGEDIQAMMVMAGAGMIETAITVSVMLEQPTPVIGRPFRCVVAGAGSEPVTYQWYRSSSTLIAGATSATYTPTETDYNNTLFCRVTVAGVIHNTERSERVIRDFEAVLANNSPRRGEFLKCRVLQNGTELSSVGNYSFQWRRDGVTLVNTTTQTYVVTPEDVGHVLSCVVTYTAANENGPQVIATAVNNVAQDATARLLVGIESDSEFSPVTRDFPCSIWIYSADLQTRMEMGAFPDEYRDVTGLAYDGANYWGIDSTLNRLFKFDLAAPGTVEAFDLPVQLAAPSALEYDGTYLWCANRHNLELWRITLPVGDGQPTFALIGPLTSIADDGSSGFPSVVFDMTWTGSQLLAAVTFQSTSPFSIYDNTSSPAVWEINRTDPAASTRIDQLTQSFCLSGLVWDGARVIGYVPTRGFYDFGTAAALDVSISINDRLLGFSEELGDLIWI